MRDLIEKAEHRAKLDRAQYLQDKGEPNAQPDRSSKSNKGTGGAKGDPEKGLLPSESQRQRQEKKLRNDDRKKSDRFVSLVDSFLQSECLYHCDGVVANQCCCLLPLRLALQLLLQQLTHCFLLSLLRRYLVQIKIARGSDEIMASIVFILVVVVILSFTGYGVDVESIADRSNIILTALLTVVVRNAALLCAITGN